MRDFRCWKIKYKLNEEILETRSYSGLDIETAKNIFQTYIKPNSIVLEISEEDPKGYNPPHEKK